MSQVGDTSGAIATTVSSVPLTSFLWEFPFPWEILLSLFLILEFFK